MNFLQKIVFFFFYAVRYLFRSTFVIISLIGLLGWFLYQQYHNHQALVVQLHHLKSSLPAQKPLALDDQLLPGCAVGPQAASLQSWTDIQGNVRDSVAQVISQAAQFDWLEPYKTPAQGQVSGSAFFINQEGELITNAHVVNQAKAVYIQIPSLGKRRLEVDVIGISPDRDLALLRLRPHELDLIKEFLKKVPTLSFGNSDKVARAEEIMALGYPLGQQSLKSTTGVVSGREHIMGRYMIQISTPINPGNSGGPSLNRCGQVIGVNTAGIHMAQNVNYIIPSNEVQLFLSQLEQLPDENKIKFLRRPCLGVMYNNATDDLARYLGNPVPGGMYIVETLSGTPLHKAGVKAGDMLYEINGHKLDVFGDINMPWSEDKISITDYVSGLMLGEDVHLKIYRQGKEMAVVFKLDQSDPNGVCRMYPGYETIDYEVIGGMVLMQLSLDHVQLLVQVAPDLTRFVEPKAQIEPAVIITHVMPDSAATRARSVGTGAVLSEINGIKIKTLDDARAAIRKGLSNDVVTLKTTENTFAVLPLRRMLEDEQKLSSHYFYHITPFVQSLLAEAKIT